ncbi:class I SAM-dependent methyltransferase [soil metagenome]
MQKEDFSDLYALEEKFWWFAGMREIAASLLDDFCERGNLKVLDAGCGTGLNLEWLRRYALAGNIFGLDYSADAIDFCRERKLENLVQGSATDLPFADESFDLITSFDVLVQLFGETGDTQAIGEMFRVLKPNGLVFVRGAAYQWMRSGHDIAVNSQRRYTLSELRSKIESAGFSVLRSTYANTLLFPAAVVRRHLMKPLGIGETGSDVKPLPSKMDWLNSFFTKNMLAEARFLKNSKRSLPFGLSAICIARKNS